MIETFAAYLRERFKPKVFGPAAVLLAAAALWSAGASPRVTFGATALGLAVVLLLQFRLWDDIEDRERDRYRHPERVLVRSDPAPFRLTCVLLMVLNVLLLVVIGARAAALGLGCLDLFFWMAYGRLRQRLPDRAWRFQILLLKYPVFVGLLAASLGSPLSLRLLVAAVAVYVCACAYETLHDRQKPLGTMS